MERVIGEGGDAARGSFSLKGRSVSVHVKREKDRCAGQ